MKAWKGEFHYGTVFRMRQHFGSLIFFAIPIVGSTGSAFSAISPSHNVRIRMLRTHTCIHLPFIPCVLCVCVAHVFKNRTQLLDENRPNSLFIVKCESIFWPKWNAGTATQQPAKSLRLRMIYSNLTQNRRIQHRTCNGYTVHSKAP